MAEYSDPDTEWFLVWVIIILSLLLFLSGDSVWSFIGMISSSVFGFIMFSTNWDAKKQLMNLMFVFVLIGIVLFLIWKLKYGNIVLVI